MREEPKQDDPQNKPRQDPRETNTYALLWLFGILMEFVGPILLVMFVFFCIRVFS